MRSKPSSGLWIGAALGANLILAAIILGFRSTNMNGTSTALRATARVLSLVLGGICRRGVDDAVWSDISASQTTRARLGLAFAAALLVHLMLVGRLCWIGKAPAAGVFIFFGTAAGVTYLLAALSFGNLHAVFGPKGWQLFRIIGMNFILVAFFTDFMQITTQGQDSAPYGLFALRRDGGGGSLA